MAARFGGSPAQSYTNQVRVIVGILSLVIIILVVFVAFLVNSSSSSNEAPMASTAPAMTSNSSATTMIDIIVAKQRIEEGVQIQPHLVSAVGWSADQLPEGSIQAREQDLIIGKYSKTMIPANMPILKDSISDQIPLSSLPIPPGFRAVTILVDNRSGVEGFAKPNSRVDVLFNYRDKDGKQKIATIVRFTKILSVGGSTGTAVDARAASAQGQTTVTLLVSERDSKKIELARSIGNLTLALVSDQDPGKTRDDPEILDEKSILGDLTGDGTGPVEEEIHTGSILTRDPKSGNLIRMLLKNGRWVRDESF